MCTCIDFTTKDHYFGRNLDLEYRFGEKVVITPRGYGFSLKCGNVIHTKYAMIGMAAVVDDYPLYAEAANEKGLSMAGLYFPKNAFYFKEDSAKQNLTAYELIPFFLGLHSTVAQVREIIQSLNITDIPFAPDMPVTDLHWMISDGKECIVMEQTEDGLHVYDNPAGVLTNNPPFPYHLSNLNNYMNLTAGCPENKFSDKLNLEQYGNGMGAIGLPGDSSPASRFVRAAFHKCNSVCKENEACSVTQFFHILDSVAMVAGSTITKDGKEDYTVYSCCCNTDQGVFYYKTYSNNQITAVRMTEKEKSSNRLSVYELAEQQQIKFEN